MTRTTDEAEVPESYATAADAPEEASIQAQLECLYGELEDVMAHIQGVENEASSLVDIFGPVLSNTDFDASEEELPDPTLEFKTELGEKIYEARTLVARQNHKLQKESEFIHEIQKRSEV